MLLLPEQRRFFILSFALQLLTYDGATTSIFKLLPLNFLLLSIYFSRLRVFFFSFLFLLRYLHLLLCFFQQLFASKSTQTILLLISSDTNGKSSQR